MVRIGANILPPSGIDEIATKIVDAVYTVHKALGPGLLKNIFESCFCHELNKRGLHYQRQVSVPITYEGITFNEGLHLDVLVEEKVIWGWFAYYVKVEGDI